MVSTYEREKKIRVGKKAYVYKYRVTEENLGLVRIEQPVSIPGVRKAAISVSIPKEAGQFREERLAPKEESLVLPSEAEVAPPGFVRMYKAWKASKQPLAALRVMAEGSLGITGEEFDRYIKAL